MAQPKAAELAATLQAHPHFDKARGLLLQAATPKAQIIGGRCDGGARCCHFRCVALLPSPSAAPAPRFPHRPCPRPSPRSLLWFFCLSWMHKVLAAGFVCLHLKAQGHISSTTEMQARRTCLGTCNADRDADAPQVPPTSPPLSPPSPRASCQVGEAVDQIKKKAKMHARRMSMAVRRPSEPLKDE